MRHAQQTQQKPQGQKPVTPRDNSDVKAQVDRFINAVTDMQTVLCQETDCLKKADRHGFYKLQDQKIEAAQKYSEEIGNMNNLGKELKEKYPDLIPYLQEKRDELHGHIQENEAALNRMQKSTQRLSDRIMEIARQAAVEQNTVAYGRGGHIGDRKNASMGLSESV